MTSSGGHLENSIGRAVAPPDLHAFAAQKSTGEAAVRPVQPSAPQLCLFTLDGAL